MHKILALHTIAYSETILSVVDHTQRRKDGETKRWGREAVVTSSHVHLTQNLDDVLSLHVTRRIVPLQVSKHNTTRDTLVTHNTLVMT